MKRRLLKPSLFVGDELLTALAGQGRSDWLSELCGKEQQGGSCSKRRGHLGPCDARDPTEVQHEPERVLLRRRKGGKQQVLVKWRHFHAADSTWEDEAKLRGFSVRQQYRARGT